MERQILKARWVFPVERPPLEHAVVEVEGSHISAVYAGDHPQAVDLGNTAIIPGLINAHTHLEFSDLENPLGPVAPFTNWIQSVMKSRFESSTSIEPKIRKGIQECLESGTTCIGEIATSVASLHLFAQNQQVPHVVVFRECLGFSVDRISEQERIADQFFEEIPDQAESHLIQLGLSPHAPYSVHPDLYLSLVNEARNQVAPVAVHLAETQAELDFLERKQGPFVKLLTELGLWDPNILREDVRMFDYLAPLAELTSALAVHGNYFGEIEIEFLRQAPQISVVYCPRTHHYFGHTPHPWLRMIERGINVAIGTDSRASSPDLSLWNELQFLRENFSEISPDLILECGTLAGARALGLSQEVGSLTIGKRADLALVQLPDGSKSSTGSDLLLNAQSHVARVMLNGGWVN